MRSIRRFGLAAVLAVGGMSAHAGLFTRNGGTMIYDDVLNVTWLADFNHANTSGYSTGFGGAMVLGASTDLAGDDTVNGWLKQINSTALNGYSGWRLPSVVDTGALGCEGNFSYGGTDCGYNVQTNVGNAFSELAHLFHVSLGNLADYDTNGNLTATPGLLNKGLFSNMQEDFYWSGTHGAGANEAWAFSLFDGYQDVFDKSYEFYAVAVRNGDVATVPEPQSLALVLLALGAGAVARRRRLR